MLIVEKQKQQKEWHDQWRTFNREEIVFLFKDWIYPLKLEDLVGKSVLEAGCGGGVHTEIMAPFAQSIIAVDLNTIDLAQNRLERFKHIRLQQDDIATMKLKEQFDVVMSIAVVHHTDSPDKTIANLKHHVKPGGQIVLWVYAKEGNWMVEHIVEPIRKACLKNLRRDTLAKISWMITALLYIPIFTIYFLPLHYLPYYKYFKNFRKMPFNRNFLNVFDKLNAPQVEFITKERALGWFLNTDFEVIHISHYVGVSWRISARKRM